MEQFNLLFSIIVVCSFCVLLYTLDHIEHDEELHDIPQKLHDWLVEHEYYNKWYINIHINRKNNTIKDVVNSTRLHSDNKEYFSSILNNSFDFNESFEGPIFWEEAINKITRDF